MIDDTLPCPSVVGKTVEEVHEPFLRYSMFLAWTLLDVSPGTWSPTPKHAGKIGRQTQHFHCAMASAAHSRQLTPAAVRSSSGWPNGRQRTDPPCCRPTGAGQPVLRHRAQQRQPGSRQAGVGDCRLFPLAPCALGNLILLSRHSGCWIRASSKDISWKRRWAGRRVPAPSLSANHAGTEPTGQRRRRMSPPLPSMVPSRPALSPQARHAPWPLRR